MGCLDLTVVSSDSLPPNRCIPGEVDTLHLDKVAIATHVGGLGKSFRIRAA